MLFKCETVKEVQKFNKEMHRALVRSIVDDEDFQPLAEVMYANERIVKPAYIATVYDLVNELVLGKKVETSIECKILDADKAVIVDTFNSYLAKIRAFVANYPLERVKKTPELEELVYQTIQVGAVDKDKLDTYKRITKPVRLSSKALVAVFNNPDDTTLEFVFGDAEIQPTAVSFKILTSQIGKLISTISTLTTDYRVYGCPSKIGFSVSGTYKDGIFQTDIMRKTDVDSKFDGIIVYSKIGNEVNTFEIDFNSTTFKMLFEAFQVARALNVVGANK